MPRNIEIKARLNRRSDVEDRIVPLADSGPIVLEQVDHFYRVPEGRLKLRQINGEHAELIFYRRQDVAGPKTSHYRRVPISHPESLGTLLTDALQLIGLVKKTRTLYLIGQTRIHLDEVEDLGSYLELEVVLDDDQSEVVGQAIALELMTKLGIAEDDLVEEAYIDHLGA
ncbi:class IV adenylate cyclase [Blastopirellula marina]|uniref:Adenylate cyclase n=1 Tax=Blastopirellula marina TaxID=124 RepID=A0A2S8FLU8_9BACT|nr:class IV adenylate cyclase [Blastopirellula marina]PQO32990.1 adenylate cyclase [Blastopirellula marina]PTL43157.1 CYTH domain-containing protein [Blastopirellula marina]